MTYEPWAETEMPRRGDSRKLMRGKHWEFPMILAGVKDEAVAYAKIKAAFLANGWTQQQEWIAGGRFFYAYYKQSGVEAWATMWPGPERATIELIESAPMPFKFTLAAPSVTPESVSPTAGDFPYLMPLPGAKLRSSAADPSPFSITPKGASKAEMVAPGSIRKGYRQPEGLSNSLFKVAYQEALTAAGWTIDNVAFGADVAISAHYAKNGRSIWAYLHNNGDGYDIQVADAGSVTKTMSADLKKNCHVALYGVLFDFDKSTLQPVSDAVLEKILALLKQDAALKLEIQGHTDNVGNEAYNLKLSDARARSVVTWLTQHGIAAARLTSKGYGMSKPIAPNTNDEGRAKNRRVEIADPHCAANHAFAGENTLLAVHWFQSLTVVR